MGLSCNMLSKPVMGYSYIKMSHGANPSSLLPKVEMGDSPNISVQKATAACFVVGCWQVKFKLQYHLSNYN